MGAHEIRQLPDDIGTEVAIAGRSNAGKSSVLNVITANSKLARISKTPGRTQQMNIFVLDDERRLLICPYMVMQRFLSRCASIGGQH